MAQSPIEKLIDLQTATASGIDVGSDDRRGVLRLVTNNFMVAPDRYANREMEFFDLLLSRSARAMDLNIRKLVAMTLVRAGARDEHVKLILTDIASPNDQFLRRTVVQSRQDLMTQLREKTNKFNISGDETLGDGNSLTLPSHFAAMLFAFIGESFLNTLTPKIGADRTALVERTLQSGRPTIITGSMEAARDEIVMARRTIRDWVRRQTISDELLNELLEARAMTEFVFALSAICDIDIATTIRILNDNSFESLAISAKANNIRRSVFAKMITGFTHRRSDTRHTDRILGLYDQISIESAERTIRFWRLRVADLGETRTSFNTGLDDNTHIVEAV